MIGDAPKRRGLSPPSVLPAAWAALCFSLSCSGAASGSAGEIRQAVAELDPVATEVSVEFAVDPESGRAWVEIAEHSGDAEAMPSFRRVEVTGLYFDVQASAVVLQARGMRAVCARQTGGGGWLRRSKLEPTGHCEWQMRPREKTFDNGFSVADTTAVQLWLVGKPGQER